MKWVAAPTTCAETASADILRRRSLITRRHGRHFTPFSPSFRHPAVVTGDLKKYGTIVLVRMSTWKLRQLYLSICFSNLQLFFKTAIFLSSSTYCSRRISIAVFVDDDVLEWNLMFDGILYEKYLWLKWPECINFCRTLHLDEGGVIYNKEKCCIVQHP